MGLDSSVGIATRYGLDGPGIESRWGARFSSPVQTGPGAHPASYTMGNGSFPGVKRLGRGVDHPPPFSVEVKVRVTIPVIPYGPSWPVLGQSVPFYFIRWPWWKRLLRDRPSPLWILLISLQTNHFKSKSTSVAQTGCRLVWRCASCGYVCPYVIGISCVLCEKWAKSRTFYLIFHI